MRLVSFSFEDVITESKGPCMDCASGHVPENGGEFTINPDPGCFYDNGLVNCQFNNDN